MSIIPLADAQANLDAWVAASLALATSQSYTITEASGASRQLTRADAGECRKWIEFWSAQVSAASPSGLGRRRLRYGVME